MTQGYITLNYLTTCTIQDFGIRISHWFWFAIFATLITVNTGIFIDYFRLDEDGKVLTPEEILYRVSFY